MVPTTTKEVVPTTTPDSSVATIWTMLNHIHGRLLNQLFFALSLLDLVFKKVFKINLSLKY